MFLLASMFSFSMPSTKHKKGLRWHKPVLNHLYPSLCFVAVLGLDSPRETTIEPSATEIHVGQELTCTTRASPDAHAYEWFQDDTVSVGVNQIFMIPDDWLGDHINLTCQATNAVGSERKSISFSVVRKYYA